MARILIPMEPNAYYSQQVTLDSHEYIFTFRWNGAAPAWFVDIEGLTNDVEIPSLRLVTGINLLDTYGIVELGGLAMIDTSGNNNDPDFDNIGTIYQLYYNEL